MKSTELVGYCGGYCGDCHLAQENVAFGIKLLHAINTAYGPTRGVENFGWEPMRNLGKYATQQLDTLLASLSSFAVECFPKCCLDHCVPPCEIAGCAQAKGYRTCGECEEMSSCIKLDKHREKVISNLEDIKKIGVDAFATQQSEKVVEQRRQTILGILDAINQLPSND